MVPNRVLEDGAGLGLLPAGDRGVDKVSAEEPCSAVGYVCCGRWRRGAKGMEYRH